VIYDKKGLDQWILEKLNYYKEGGELYTKNLSLFFTFFLD